MALVADGDIVYTAFHHMPAEIPRRRVYKQKAFSAPHYETGISGPKTAQDNC